jgi:hypothetical protein
VDEFDAYHASAAHIYGPPGTASPTGGGTTSRSGSGAPVTSTALVPAAHGVGVTGFTYDAGAEASARGQRTGAAIRRLYEAAGVAPDGGRGINNTLSRSEIRAVAAHLSANVRAFRPEAQGGQGGALSFDSIAQLVAASRVIDVPAKPTPRAPGLLAPGVSVAPAGPAGAAASPLHSALTDAVTGAANPDPTLLGIGLVPAIVGAPGSPPPPAVAASAAVITGPTAVYDDALYRRGGYVDTAR